MSIRTASLALLGLSCLAAASESTTRTHITTFKRLDANRDGNLSFREFGPKHHRLSSTLRTVRKTGSSIPIAEIEAFQREIFEAFDADSNGSVDLLEWQIFRQDPLGSLSIEDWRSMPAMDLDSDGTVYQKEFRRFTTLYLPQTASDDCFLAIRQAYPSSGSFMSSETANGAIEVIGLLPVGNPSKHLGSSSSISQSFATTDPETLRAWILWLENLDRLQDLDPSLWLSTTSEPLTPEILGRLEALRQRENRPPRRGGNEDL